MSAITCPYTNDMKRESQRISSKITKTIFNPIRERSACSMLDCIDQNIKEVKNEWERINNLINVEGEEARYIIKNLIPAAREFTKEEARLHEESINEMFESTGRNIFDL